MIKEDLPFASVYFCGSDVLEGVDSRQQRLSALGTGTLLGRQHQFCIFTQAFGTSHAEIRSWPDSMVLVPYPVVHGPVSGRAPYVVRAKDIFDIAFYLGAI